MRKRTILFYGRTRAGKTTQLGELAEYVKKTTGKKMLLYFADKGGADSIQNYIDLGLIDAVYQLDTPIFIFLSKACAGQIRDAQGKWVPADLTQYGCVAFESMTAFADSMMDYMIEQSSQGVNIGGGGNVSFSITDGTDTLKVGGSNMAMYGICQSRITSEVWKSQKLNVEFIVWTASQSKDEDLNAGGKVIGPAVIGKALTTEVPRWFQLTFRIDCLPAQGGKPEEHILYLGNNTDLAAGNATALGNTRTPLDSDPLPSSIKPASIVKALDLIDKAETQAKAKIKARLGIK